MLGTHHHAPPPGSRGIRGPPRAQVSSLTLANPTPTSRVRVRGYKQTRAALFPVPNFHLKNFSVPSQYNRAGTLGEHSPPRAALGVRGCGSAPGCPHLTAAAPGARGAHGPRASAERPVRLTGAHGCPAPAAAWPGGGRLGSEPAARSPALNW